MIIVVRILGILIQPWIFLKVISSENGVPLLTNLVASRRKVAACADSQVWLVKPNAPSSGTSKIFKLLLLDVRSKSRFRKS
jgi:hypothetical protein